MTHEADGKYCTLDQLKLYGLGAIADPNNTTIYNNAVQNTPDDGLLSQCIHRAEFEFDRIAGIQFDELTMEDVMGFTPFVDGNGLLHVWAREHAPVTAVTSVEVRDMLGNRTWTAISWSAGDIILPVNDGLPHPDSAQVMIIPTTPLPSRSTGQIYVRWTYTGGFATIPTALTALISRFAWWIYKIREAPMAKIVNPVMNIMEIPLRIPPDIDSSIKLWQPIYS